MLEENIPPQLVNAWQAVKPLADAVYPNLSTELPSIVIMMVSIAVYGVLVYHFYRFVAKRDVFAFGIEKYKTEETGFFAGIFNAFFGFVKYGLFFPLIVFFWFAGFSLMLFLMAKNIDIPQILLVSVVFVAAIRITSYYTEDLSRDLAKLIPLALLGVAIIDPVFFSTALFFERIAGISAFIPKIAAYFVFIIILEWVFRILLSFKRALFGKSKNDKKKQALA